AHSRRERVEVAQVARAVAIGVRLVGVGDRRAVVPLVRNAVTVDVGGTAQAGAGDRVRHRFGGRAHRAAVARGRLQGNVQRLGDAARVAGNGDRDRSGSVLEVVAQRDGVRGRA